jgi:hypothetical protein
MNVNGYDLTFLEQDAGSIAKVATGHGRALAAIVQAVPLQSLLSDRICNT